LLQYHYPSEFQDFMSVWTHNAFYGVRNRLFSRILLLRAADSIPWKWQEKSVPMRVDTKILMRKNVLWLP